MKLNYYLNWHLLFQEELTAIIGNKNNAQMLYRALHDKHKPENTTATASMSKASMKMRSKGLFSSKK